MPIEPKNSSSSQDTEEILEHMPQKEEPHQGEHQKGEAIKLDMEKLHKRYYQSVPHAEKRAKKEPCNKLWKRNHVTM